MEKKEEEKKLKADLDKALKDNAELNARLKSFTHKLQGIASILNC